MAWTKEQQTAYYKQYYKKHKKRLRRQMKLRYDNIASIVRNLKDIPCTDCGQKFPPECMDFDHLRDKSFNVATGATRSIETLLKEIEKCEVVCANCHRTRTKRRRSKAGDAA
jgi:5-methylcytosine-specific restriction endonuclease McrA